MLLKRILISVCAMLSVAAAFAAPAVPAYFCDFEDEAECSQWYTWGGATAARQKHSTWKTGGAAYYMGRRGMYISDPEVDPNGGNTQSSQKSGGFSVSVYRKITLDPGSYIVSLVYKCPTELLSVSLINADTLIASNIQTQTGADYAAIVKNALIEGLKDMKATDWTRASVTHQVATAGTYLLAVTYRTSTGTRLDFGAAVDNVEVVKLQTDPEGCDYPIADLDLSVEGSAASLTWKGNADTYELRCYDWAGNLIFTDTVADSGAIDSYNFSSDNYLPGAYRFMVRGLGCDDNDAKTGWAYFRHKLGTVSEIADACPEVTLTASDIVDGEKYMLPTCNDEGKFKLKPTVVAGGGSIAGYQVNHIDYGECPFPFDLDLLPPSQRNRITTITEDDYWDTHYINLPFPVCFFENTYRRALVGANGLVTFDSSIGLHARCEWNLEGQPDVPSRDFQYKNCIMGVYQDYYPVPSAGGRQQIWYGVLGEWPCRKMVVCFNEVPMFANHTTINSSMIVMYEGTNVIDVYVKNRDLSPSGWNDNRGIIAVINADGTDGEAAPGRNTTDGNASGRAWSAHHEAWRFLPYASPEYTLTWYKGAFSEPAALDAYLEQHPGENIILSDQDSIEVAEEDGINAVTVRLQYVQCNGDRIDILDHAYINWPHADTLKVDAVTCQDVPYSDQYVQNADRTDLYEVAIPDQNGCDSVIYKLNLKVLPRDTMRLDTVLCAGETLDYEGLHKDTEGSWEIHHSYKSCDCDSVIEVVNLSLLDKLEAGVADFPDHICADDPLFSFRLRASIPGERYNVHFEPTGSGFEDIHNAEAGLIEDVLIHSSGQVVPGYYTMYIEVEDDACGAAFDSVHFVVNYPASIAPQKWGNVLVILDEAHNGGYYFSHIQWYRNGEPIEGATGPYYYAGDGELFDHNSTYTVGLTRSGETYEIQTCPLGDWAAGTGLDNTGMLDPNVLPLQLDGRMIIYDVLGRIIANEAYDYYRLQAVVHQGREGLYLIKVISPVGNQVYRVYSRN